MNKMCGQMNLDREAVFHRAKLLLGVYRDVVWAALGGASEIREEGAARAEGFYGRKMAPALGYLMEFEPLERKEDFEARVTNLFETVWLIELVEKAMLRVYDYPRGGRLYFEILAKSYLTALHYSETELLEIFCMERSVFYERRKEASLLLGISLWGFAIPELKKICLPGNPAAAIMEYPD
jgi:hypothetical protein